MRFSRQLNARMTFDLQSDLDIGRRGMCNRIAANVVKMLFENIFKFDDAVMLLLETYENVRFVFRQLIDGFMLKRTGDRD